MFFFNHTMDKLLIFLIPLIIYMISKSPIKNLISKAPFSSGFLIGLGLFLLHTKYLYGIYTLNQALSSCLLKIVFQLIIQDFLT